MRNSVLVVHRVYTEDVDTHRLVDALLRLLVSKPKEKGGTPIGEPDHDRSEEPGAEPETDVSGNGSTA